MLALMILGDSYMSLDTLRISGKKQSMKDHLQMEGRDLGKVGWTRQAVLQWR